ncbi:transketolase [Methylovirgula ligni]|uniref:Transketolase n=1 Tax=Methylovirgula ligni TaxID=569860 RepID=A0A3D9YQ55_9HYPH|nr:transketolase [Methylovirgula ligni]QAY97165.1 transketolase [Methylovirgula ligni]REF84635.1 transketolase [Methylovirgula ligni]
MNVLAKAEAGVTHAELANAIRFLAIDAVEAANSGHPGMPMGMADVATVLFTRFLKFDAADPAWPDRDRFVLSAGHGSMLLYALLYLTGYPEMTIEEIKRFRQLGSKTPGHPEYGHTPGVETTTGPLGQGLATAVGMAIAERLLGARYGGDLVDHRTYVVVGDGCLMEGVSQEAITLAGHLKLSKLVVLWDNNSITIDGAVNLSDSTDQVARFKAAGWDAWHIDGHDPQEIAAALSKAQQSDRPVLIACKTQIGFGAPNKVGTHGVHGAALGAAEVAATREKLGWTAPAFEIPGPILAAWRAAGARGKVAREAWTARHLGEAATRFDSETAGTLSPDLAETIAEFKRAASGANAAQATRVSSQKTLDVLAKIQPNLLGGSADLTGSNNTKAADMQAVTPVDFSGRYIHYGIREFGMAAALNGLALHGGFIPYGGTFLVFADYARPAIRLSALMRQRVIYVLTHDSIGLGEDGPTHQPVETLASLRAIPHLYVFRPADAVETAESWELALQLKHAPSVLALSRQNLPVVRTAHKAENFSALGAYVLREAPGERDVTLLATGSEVSLAVKAAEQLAAQNIKAAVVSIPCFELFAEQEPGYRAAVLGQAPRIGIEAALRQGWGAVLEPQDFFIGMTDFGASAPAADLYKFFGITVDAIVQAARAAAGHGTVS